MTWTTSDAFAGTMASPASAPILMLNGKYDIIFSWEGSQIPLFQALGTPEQDKYHYLINGGHCQFNREGILKTLGWLDRYLGPVRIR